jgi:hypothetical protein
MKGPVAGQKYRSVQVQMMNAMVHITVTDPGDVKWSFDFSPSEARGLARSIGEVLAGTVNTEVVVEAVA